MIPMVRNSALAIATLSGGNQRTCTLIGSPVDLMKCSTPFLVGVVTKLGIVISGKFEIN